MAGLKLATAPEGEEQKFDGRGIETYKRWFQNAEETHQKARALAHRDRDWYDNYDDGQWDDKEKQILIRRGQPVVTMNRIKRKVNFLCGIEQKSRSDPKAYPRKPQNTDQAQVATDVLDYIENTVRFDNVASASFKSLCIEGIAAVDVCYEEGEGAAGIVAKEIDYDQFFYDPRSRRPDYSDARYLGYHNWYDLEDALAMFAGEEAKAALNGSLSGETTDEGYDDKPRFRWGDAERQRVRIACMYWKDAKGGWNYVYFAGGGIIEEGESKYLDDKGRTDCPIIAASAYVTRENERYGTVRDMISPQSEMNYRRSMALFLMKNRRVWSAAGVFNPDQNIKEEIARADAHIIANGQFGTEWGFIESQSEVAQNFELLQDAKGEIDVQGPNAGLQGRGVEQQSGKAIQVQQNAGLAEENTLFDTHNDWKLRVYRAFWARAKQFWTEEMFIRISDEDAPGGARFTPVNASPQSAMAAQQTQPMQGQPPQMPMGQPDPMMALMGGAPQGGPMGGMPPQMPQMGGQPDMMAMMGGMGQMPGMEPPKVNALAEMDVDIVIEAAPDMLTLQHEQFEQLADMAGKGVPIPPDVLLEASQIRNKKKLIERLKADGDLQQKLAAAEEQMKQMKMVIDQQQRQLLKEVPGEAQGEAPQGPDPVAMMKAQNDGAKLQLEARKADRDDALAQATIQELTARLALINAQAGKANADAYKAVEDANRPPPAPKGKP